MYVNYYRNNEVIYSLNVSFEEIELFSENSNMK